MSKAEEQALADATVALDQFAFIYERCVELATIHRPDVSNMDPSPTDRHVTFEAVLAMVHMVYGRMDQEFDKQVALKKMETDQLNAVYGGGYGMNDE